MTDLKEIPDDDFLALNLFRNDVEKEVFTYDGILEALEKVDLETLLGRTAVDL